MHDLPLLEAVTHPVAVDPRLATLATELAWQVLKR
jgi:phosphoserine phosphatase